MFIYQVNNMETENMDGRNCMYADFVCRKYTAKPQKNAKMKIVFFGGCYPATLLQNRAPDKKKPKK